MNDSSILAIAALGVTALVALFTLATEKKESEPESAAIRRWRKPVLYLLTLLAFLIGTSQIRKADKESRDTDTKHAQEHQQDQQKISGLQDSLTTLAKVNDVQYQRNQEQLQRLRQELSDLKSSKMTAEDREKIGRLEAQLREALAPKPKAVMDFGFYYPNLAVGEIRKDVFLASNGSPIKVPLVVSNVSKVNATDLMVWVRVCEKCKFHSEPRASIKPDKSPDFDRLFKIGELPPGVANGEINVEIEVPRDVTRAAISLSYRCPDCEIEEDWHTLWIDIGQLPIPKFAPPACTAKSPLKSPSPKN